MLLFLENSYTFLGMFFVLLFKVRDIHIFLLEIFDRVLSIFFRVIFSSFWRNRQINPLNTESNPTCCLQALLAHHIFHVSRIRVNTADYIVETFDFWGLMLFMSHSLLPFRRW
jgi:hypothetical protein